MCLKAKEKVGIIGYGNMGSAIAKRIKSKYSVTVFDKDLKKTTDIKGIEVAQDIKDLLEESEIVILAVKPQDFEQVLLDVKDDIKDKLIISIAAGITTRFIESRLGLGRVRLARVMPNIGAVVGKAVSYICKGSFFKTEDLKLSRKLFTSIGHTFVISEDLMDAATAAGGSGPGFWGYKFDKIPPGEWDDYKTKNFIPEFAFAIRSLGFDRKTAEKTAHFVTGASISTVKALHITPLELTKKVASKGGTTEAGLEVLQRGGSLKDAVKAAMIRARELSRR